MQLLILKAGKLLGKHGISLSGILVFAGLGFFSGDLPQNYNLTGLSPYYSAAQLFEDRIFQERIRERRQSRILETEGIQNRIQRVIAHYHTGLDKQYEQRIPEWIVAESRKYGYDPLFLTAIIITESSFYNWARSDRGALGLMQIRPATGVALASETNTEWKGTPTLFDPGINIALGTYYFDKLVKRFGDLKLALEAYNYGPSKLRGFLNQGKRPRAYSRKVYRNYEKILTLLA